MASSSSAEALKYDVFLSFRGECRNTFISHLHAALKQKQIKTYIDYELVRGEEIAPALLEAIEGSELSVVILSHGYASSKWCLDELVHILECKETRKQIVIPIFYGVDPSDVRNQRESYAAAFLQHEERFKDTPDSVLKWREALTNASKLAGFDSRNFGRESELVEEIVRDILMKLSGECSSDLKGLVGMESRIQKLESLLCIIPQDVRVRTVGIWGMGGVGKTTLAGLVFNRLKSRFEASHFLADVREESGRRGIKALQNELTCNLLKYDCLRIGTPSIGSTFNKKRLSRAKVLVVLDDVNDVSQLEILVGKQVQFGPGSRIIITTRDMHQLREMQQLHKGANHDVMIYKAEELDFHEALHFFHLKDSKEISYRADYSELVRKVVHSAAGIPLTLKVWGSLFRQCRTSEERECLLKRLKRFPEKKVQNVYRISYDALGENEREIFLYIACFHKGEDECRAKEELNACGLYADSGINVLIDMSLVSIQDNKLWMHDVIQEMGRAIECEQKPGKRKRLCTPEDVCHVLKKNKGTKNVESISLDLSTITQLQLTQAFKKMRNLKFLKLYRGDRTGNVQFNLQDLEYLPNSLIHLSWPAYTLKYLPSTFSAENLIELSMPRSKLQRLWGEGQPRNLKRIDLSYSKELVEVPDLSMCVNIETIKLSGCRRLVEVPSYFKNFHKLTTLNVSCCRSLRVLSDMPRSMVHLQLIDTAIEHLPSSIWCLELLQSLCLSGCNRIKNIPNSIGNLGKLYSLTMLSLCETIIEEFPSSIECLSELWLIQITNCKRFINLPPSICKLKSLRRLHLNGCSSFEKFPEILEPMKLETLDLGGTKFKELPCLIENVVGRKELDLPGCRSFESVSNRILPLSSVILWSSMTALEFSGCKMLEEIPDCIFSLNDLCILDVSGTMIRRIPATINQASWLWKLVLKNCELLESLPELPFLIQRIDARGCKRLKTFCGFTAAPTEGFDVEIPCHVAIHIFDGCPRLATRNLVDGAHLRNIATIFYPGGEYEVRCRGDKIPKWVSNQREGCRIHITLPLHWSEDDNFLGLAFCVIVDMRLAPNATHCVSESIFKTEDGESYNYTWPSNDFPSSILPSSSDHSDDTVMVWYRPLSKVRSAPSTNATRASFHFDVIGCNDSDGENGYNDSDGENEQYGVKRCGVGFVYAKSENAVNWQVRDERQHTEATASENSDTSDSYISDSDTSDSDTSL